MCDIILYFICIYTYLFSLRLKCPVFIGLNMTLECRIHFYVRHMKIRIWQVWPIYELYMMLASIMKTTLLTSFEQYHLI